MRVGKAQRASSSSIGIFGEPAEDDWGVLYGGTMVAAERGIDRLIDNVFLMLKQKE